MLPSHYTNLVVFPYQEEASLQRRHAAARQALSGKAPSAYVQLFQR